MKAGDLQSPSVNSRRAFSCLANPNLSGLRPSGGGRNRNIGEKKPGPTRPRKENRMNSFDMKFKRGGKRHKKGRGKKR